jgi:putative membrane protein
MNTQRNTILVTVGGLLLLCASVAASAQTPAPATGSATQPSAASSPQQRSSTSVETAEAPTGGGTNPADASSPHQRQATGDVAHVTSPAAFVEKAAQDGMTEVKLAELAQQKSQSDAVKNFAMHMQQDHTKANSELESLASSKNITVPTGLDARHRKMVDLLSGKSGAAFDKAYANAMVKDHKQAVALFKQAQSAKDPDISSFAAKTLPTLQEHQQMANQLDSQLRVATAGGNSTAQ